MIIKADLKCKQTDFSLPRCAIEKVVKFLSDTMIFSENSMLRNMGINLRAYHVCYS